MPRILFRYASLDLLRVFAVTAAVLVVVVAFGSLIKPLSANLLGALAALRYAALATVPVLEYAVPFATGFACTLATHRMAVDNEVTALSAAGMAMWRILLPQVAVGTACGAALFVLVNSAVPEVENLMREMLAREAGRVVLSQLRDGESVSAGNVVIHADRAFEMAVPEPSQDGTLTPRDRLLLEGVAAFESDAQGKPLTEFVARRAVVDLYEMPATEGTPAATALKLRLEDVVVVRPLEGSAARVPTLEPGAFVLGAVGARPTQYLTGPDLLRAIDQPGQTAQALEARERLEMEVADAEALIAMARSLEATGSASLVDPATARTYDIEQARLEGRTLRPREARGVISVTERQGGTLLRTATMRSAQLPRARGEWVDVGGESWVAMDLIGEDVTATSAQGGARLHWPQRLQGLRAVVPAMAGGDDGALRERAAQAQGVPGPWSHELQRNLAAWDGAGRTVSRQASAYVSLRLHAALLVPIVAIFGAVAAVLLQRASPLAVYVVAFVPTLLAAILAAQGKELMRDGNALLGGTVMWSGSAAMLAAALLGLRKVGRP